MEISCGATPVRCALIQEHAVNDEPIAKGEARQCRHRGIGASPKAKDVHRIGWRVLDLSPHRIEVRARYMALNYGLERRLDQVNR